jgi:hypothetical protein
MTNNRIEVVEAIKDLLSSRFELTENDNEEIELIVDKIFDGVQKEIFQKIKDDWGKNLG